MSLVYIYNFPNERIYKNLIARLFVAFIILSLLSAIGFMILRDSAALNIVIAYIAGVIIIGIIIHSVDVKLNIQLEVKYVKTQVIKRLNTPPSLFSYHYFNTYLMTCPFCMYKIEIDQTNMTNIPIYKENDTICIHYRELAPSHGNTSYGKFVNLIHPDLKPN